MNSTDSHGVRPAAYPVTRVARILFLGMAFSLCLKGVCLAGGKLDACSLLTKAEVEAVLGDAIKEPKQGNYTPGTSDTAEIANCDYRVEGRALQSVALMARISPEPDNTPEAINSVRESFKRMGSAPVEVKGVGDVAIWGRNMLNVFKGENRSFIVTVIGAKDEAAAMEQAKTLALKVLGRF